MSVQYMDPITPNRMQIPNLTYWTVNLYPKRTTSPKHASSIVPAIKSTNPNWVSTPKSTKTEKKTMHHKFGKGIYAKIAGYNTNAKSGPDS